MKTIFKLMMLSMFLLTLSACGSGTGDNASSPPPPTSANPAATGVYKGTFVGSADSGTFTVTVDAQGNIFCSSAGLVPSSNTAAQAFLLSPNGLPPTHFDAMPTNSNTAYGIWHGDFDTVNGRVTVQIQTSADGLSGSGLRLDGTPVIPFTPAMMTGVYQYGTTGNTTTIEFIDGNKPDGTLTIKLPNDPNGVPGTYRINPDNTLTINGHNSDGSSSTVVYTLHTVEGSVLSMSYIANSQPPVTLTLFRM